MDRTSAYNLPAVRLVRRKQLSCNGLWNSASRIDGLIRPKRKLHLRQGRTFPSYLARRGSTELPVVP
jgi:hypothetical protein